MSDSRTGSPSNGRPRGVCPTVAVGASAGGLAALKEFFGALPAGIGLTFVVLQHLTPDRESLLPGLLQAATALPVATASDGMALEQGHVYVVPAARVATVQNGVLRLRPRGKGTCEQPIDDLFSSLAVDAATACGVLLSGYGADGVQGLREITATGGLAFVQDPDTAEAPDMPLAAIDAGAADVVGSPAELAGRLGEIAGLGVAPRKKTPVATAEDAKAVREILALVQHETGADFRHYKPSTIERRIARRAMLCDAPSLGEYRAILENDAREVNALLFDLLINVTRFFRDENVFAALRDDVLPAILEAKRPGEPLRIWVPGCSTGEEVYSILITLLEALPSAGPRPAVTVFGTDLSVPALRRARAGVYAEDTCAFVPPELLDRYFRKVEHGYRIDERLRDMCVFARQDITQDTPFSRIDLLSLRNVLIYMDQVLQRRVLSVAHYALVPDGFLMLGTSESTESDGRLFRTYDKQRHIYRRTDVPAHLPAEVTGTGRGFFEMLQEPVLPAMPPESIDIRAVADAASLDAFAPPRVVVDGEDHVVHFFGDTRPYLVHPEGRATLDVVEIAAPGLALELRDALAEARETNATAEREADYSEAGRRRRVAIVVEPLPAPDRTYRLVAFQELPETPAMGEGVGEVEQLYAAREERLRREIASLRGRVRHAAEEKDQANEGLRTANEEMQSSNEELQSLNEELETAKEELQSANEELITVNEELRQRNTDLALTNDDLTNFFASTGIPVIMLDRDLRVRRFTPQAERIADAAALHERRDLARVRLRVVVPHLEDLVKNVIDSEEAFERDVRDDAGRWYSMQIRPYRTSKRAVEGAVIGFVDVDDLHRSMERVSKRARLSEALATIDAEIQSAMRFDEIMQRALDRGVASLGADAGTIELRDGDAWVVRYQHGFGNEDVGMRLSDAEAPNAARAERTRKPFKIDDMTEDETVDVGFVHKYGLTSAIAVPLLVRDEVIGCLLFYGRAGSRPFGRSDTDFAGRLGASVSLALDNARLLSEERRAARSAETLAKVNEILLAALTPDEVISRLVGEVSEAAGADKALVVEVTGRTYTVTHVRNVSPDLVGASKPARFYRAFSLSAGSGRPVLIGDAWEDTRTNKSFVRAYGLRAFQLMPIHIDGENVAVLAFAWDEPRRFDATDEEFAVRTAAALSAAMRNARLYEEARRSSERIRQHSEIMEGIGTILQAALSSRSEEDLGEICLSVAEKITGSAFGFIDEIGPDGLLHDVALSDPGWAACAMQDPSGHRRPPADFEIRGLYGKVFAEARPFISNDPANEPDAIGVPEGHPPLQSFLGVPLFSDGKPLGTVCVANKEGGYGASDEAALQAIAPVIVEAFQRKRTERESAAAKERLEAHIDNSPLAVIEFDDAFRITRWSDEAQRMFGWTADEVIGKAIGDFAWVYEEDADLVDTESRSLLTAANPRSLNVNRNYRKDGSVIWCEWYDSAIYDDQGKLISILSQVLDITERRRAEEALARTSRRLEILADSARLLLTTTTPEEVVQRIGEQVMEFLDCQVFFNYLVEDGRGGMRLNAYAGIPDATAEEIAQLGMGVAVCGCVGRDGERIVAEDIQCTPDERTDLVKSFGVQAYACHPLIYQGETIGTLSFGTKTRTRFTDEELGLMKMVADQAATAMARKQAEDETRASEQRYRLLFANMLDGFQYCRMVYDDTGSPIDFEYVDVNAVFSQFTGLHDVIGKRVSDVIPGIRETNPELFEIYGRVSQGGGPEHFETEVPQLGRAYSVGVYSPHAEHFVAIFHDVTEQKERLRLDESLSSIHTAISATLSVEGIVRELASSATETLRADARQVLMKHGEQWVVTDVHGMDARIGATFSAEDLPLTNSAASERGVVSEVDTGGRATRRRSAMRRFGVRAIIMVPLLTQGRVIGVVAIARRSPTPFSDLELYFANRLASVATLALDNALAYERERAIADTLQEAVLKPPPPIQGVETASLYQPASAEARVGGDFYDVFELDGGKVGILVGDVSGKGLEAARLTSLVRDATRAYALEREDPVWVVSRVNALMYRSSPVEAFATLFFGVLDVLSGQLTYTAAGHPSAVLCTASGPGYLTETPSAIVGAFEGARFSRGEVRLGPDDVLTLYTDGVTEARRERELYGEARLLDSLQRLCDTPIGLLPQAVLDDVLSFTGGVRRDDIVIVCVKRALAEERP